MQQHCTWCTITVGVSFAVQQDQDTLWYNACIMLHFYVAVAVACCCAAADDQTARQRDQPSRLDILLGVQE